jgi:diketogulonate reductase-like aldo/keto reductase
MSNGQQLPAIGFGTWEVAPDVAADMVGAALETGYRLIDTARIYGNEEGVGEAVRTASVPREEIFVTTKVWNDDQGYDATHKAVDASLRRLGLDYIDLYLIHWPATSRRGDSWRAMNELCDQGVLRAIGVSNFSVRHLEALASEGLRVPMVNQIEFHPFIYAQQQATLNYCYDHKIVVEAYSPLARAAFREQQIVQEVADEIGRTPAQVMLRWSIQHGTIPLPRSTSLAHINENFDVFDFELSADSMNRLNELSDGRRVTWDPDKMS